MVFGFKLSITTPIIAATAIAATIDIIMTFFMLLTSFQAN